MSHARGPLATFGKSRFEAFSDGVFAIIITIMVLEMKVPQGADWGALGEMLPAVCGYTLSFLYVGIYWNNHHHLVHAAGSVSGAALWANLHLLFWLSFLPLTTGWMGQHPQAAAPAMAYGAVLLLAAIAYAILQRALIRASGTHSVLAEAMREDWKGLASPLVYLVAIGLARVHPLLAQVAYAAVAGLWMVPDRRIERVIARRSAHPSPGAARAGGH